MSASVFTKQKVSLEKGLNLRAKAYVALADYKYTDGIAIVIQNHPEGNKYIGDHGVALGVKNIQEKCAGLTIRVYCNDNKSIMVISFGDQELLNQSVQFLSSNEQQIYLQIKLLENDEAELTFGIGSDKYKVGPQTPLKLQNFRKGLCLQEKEELSAFIGFSSSKFTISCEHETQLLLFKIVEYGCGCPQSDYFPLNIIYKEDVDSYIAHENSTVLIEDLKICTLCEDYQGQNRQITLLIDQQWQIKGKKITNDNKNFIEFQLPFLPGNDNRSNKHLFSFLIDQLSFSQKQISIKPNLFIEENWQVPFVKPYPKTEKSKFNVPLTGFSINQSTQPPNIPPLDDYVKKALNDRLEKSYIVDVYSRPIYKGIQDNQLFELSQDRIKIDSIKNTVENSNSIVQVKEWIPTKDNLKIQQDQYILGQNYEFEIKHEDGSLIKLIKTHPEVALDIAQEGACYGNYCNSFFCKKKVVDDSPPIDELDRVCKEMDESSLGKLNTMMEATEAGEVLFKQFSHKLSKIFFINDIYYAGKIALAKCSHNNIECKTAKFMQIGKFLLNQINIIGKVNAIFDFVKMLIDAGYYLASKIGQWLTSKFTGDPHIKNLDGCKFDFQGQGDFILLEEKMIGFSMHSRFQQHQSFQQVTTIKAISIRGFYGAPIVYFESLQNEFDPLIRINGYIIKIEKGKTFEIPNLKIEVQDQNYNIEYSNEIKIQITNHGYGFLWTGFSTIPAIYSGKLQGILGNGDSEDNGSDFEPGNNQQQGYEKIKSCKEQDAESIWKFGQSWRLTKKEDSILYYKKDQDPDSFFDKGWKPISTKEIIQQADQQRQNEAARQCQKFQKNEEDYNNCILDMLLLQKKGDNQNKILDAYNNSKEQPQEEKVSLIYKNIDDTSVELEFGLNQELLNYCSNGCNVKIFVQRAQEPGFQLQQELQKIKEQRVSQIMKDLDKNTPYTFKVRISNKYESNLVSLYTMKNTCVPFCAKENSCGDDGCGGQCDLKVKCDSECIFGVCNIEKGSSGNSKLKIILISLGVVVLILIIIGLVFFLRRKYLIQRNNQLLANQQANSSVNMTIQN